jgi:hypothetical protein
MYKLLIVMNCKQIVHLVGPIIPVLLLIEIMIFFSGNTIGRCVEV